MKIKTLIGSLFLLASLAFGQQFSGGGSTPLPTPSGTGLCFISTGSTPGAWTWGSCTGSTSAAFSALTSGTNTTAAMVIGTGGSLNFSGSGTINASTLNGATFAAPGAIGGGTAAAGTFTTLTETNLVTGLTGFLYGNNAGAATVGTAAQLGTLFNSYISTLTGCTTAGYTYIPAGANCVASSGGFTAGGDLSGSSSSQTVTGIQGHALPTLATGYLNWTGSAWAYTGVSGGSPAFSAITAPTANSNISTGTYTTTFTEGDFGVSPVTSAFTVTDTATSTTDTSTDFSVTVPNTSYHEAVAVNVAGFSQFQVCNIGGASHLGTLLEGNALACSNLPTSTNYTKSWVVDNTASHNSFIAYQNNTGGVGTLVVMNSAQTVGSSYYAFKASNTVTTNGDGYTGGNLVSSLRGDGLFTTTNLTLTGSGCGAGTYAKADGTGCGTPSGAGTVTTFSAGSLSPLFTTSVVNAGTTPALTFSLSNAAAYAILNNNTGSSAPPIYTATPIVTSLNAQSNLLVGTGTCTAGGTAITTLCFVEGSTSSLSPTSGQDAIAFNGLSTQVSINGGAAYTPLMFYQANAATIVGLFTSCSGTQYLGADGACHSGSGGGVSSVSGDGALISNSGSTGAVTLTLGTAGAHKWWGNNTGSTGTPGYEAITASDLPAIALSGLATQAANTVVGNFTSGVAAPTATAVASCSGANDAEIYTTNTGFGCGTNFAQLNQAETFSAVQTFGTNISIGGVTAAGATGTGNIVFASSPVLTTPSATALTLTGSLPSATNTGLLNYGTLGFNDSNQIMAFQGSVNSYIQNVLQNTNTGSTASADFVVGNSATTATTFYADFGMNGTGFTGTGSLNQPSIAYMTSTSVDLVIGTTTNNIVRFVVNNGATDAWDIQAPPTTAGSDGIWSDGKPLGPLEGSFVTQTPVNTTMYSQQLNVLRPFALGHFTVNVSAGVASSNFTVCLYNAAGTTLLWGANASAASTAVASGSATQIIVQPGTYRLAWEVSGGASAASLSGIATSATISNVLNNQGTRWATTANLVSGTTCPASTGTLTASVATAMPYFTLEP